MFQNGHTTNTFSFAESVGIKQTVSNFNASSMELSSNRKRNKCGSLTPSNNFNFSDALFFPSGQSHSTLLNGAALQSQTHNLKRNFSHRLQHARAIRDNTPPKLQGGASSTANLTMGVDPTDLSPAGAKNKNTSTNHSQHHLSNKTNPSVKNHLSQ